MEKSANITDSPPLVTEGIYESLKKQCEEAGVSLSFACRRAGVERSTVERWKTKDPKTIIIYNNLLQVIQEAKTSEHE